ncbi:hypothetical protein [Streptomyces rubiginosohelvolus]|uniref:hypothetical protein n=1 Tax=Streptomyces rubiginosohelvolus TaxID=67362 RepID=UPI0035E3756E
MGVVVTAAATLAAGYPLGLVQHLGGRLRTSAEIARALTLTVTYADRSQTTRTRILTNLGLQRARVRTITRRAERIRHVEDVVRQLTFDQRDDKLHRLETALDKATNRYGAGLGSGEPPAPRPHR